jgi:hypothetical protein
MLTLHPSPIKMHLCAHGTPIANLELSELVLPHIFAWFDPRLCGLDKGLRPPHQICDWCHDKGIFFYKTSIKHIPLKIWIRCGFVGTYILTIAWTFFRSGIFPLDTMNPKFNPKNTMKTHFFWVKTDYVSLHFRKQNVSFIKLLSISL